MCQLSLQEQDLRQCQRERDEALLHEKTLEKKLQDLEMETEKNSQNKDDKSRQMKLMEVPKSLMKDLDFMSYSVKDFGL